MHRILKKDELLTIPNLLSFFRLLLIPVIVWLYCSQQNYYSALAVILLSGITDIADGIIARKYNMVSDIGKILDPLADKATQGALIICLTVKYKLMFALIAIFAIREIVMTVMGYLTLKKNDSVNSAKWYGKVNTVVVYGVIFILILLPDISAALANAMIGFSGIVMLISLILYICFYKKILSTKKSRN